MTALSTIFAHPAPAKSVPTRSVPLLALKFTRRDLRLLAILSLVALLSAVDLLFTLFANKLGILNEMNPIAATYLSSGLEPSLIAYKILMILAGSTMLWRVRHSNWALPAAWAMLTAHVILAIIWYIWTQNIIFTFNIMLTPRPKF